MARKRRGGRKYQLRKLMREIYRRNNPHVVETSNAEAKVWTYVLITWVLKTPQTCDQTTLQKIAL